VTLMRLLIALRAAQVRLDMDSDGLCVDAPAGALSDALRDAIRQHKNALLCLPRPFINAAGELVSPALAPPQYHWQPITDTLRELNAPERTWRNYTHYAFPLESARQRFAK